jgi:predicted enzyme related to lactoylglutathione lyase
MPNLPRTFRGTQAPPFVQLFIQSDDVESIAKKAQELGACLIFGPAALPDGDWMAVLTYPTGLAFAIWKPRA